MSYQLWRFTDQMFILKEREVSDISRGKVDKQQSLWPLQTTSVKCEKIGGTIPKKIDSKRSNFLRSFSFFSFFFPTQTLVWPFITKIKASKQEVIMRTFFVLPLVFSSFLNMKDFFFNVNNIHIQNLLSEHKIFIVRAHAGTMYYQKSPYLTFSFHIWKACIISTYHAKC